MQREGTLGNGLQMLREGHVMARVQFCPMRLQDVCDWNTHEVSLHQAAKLICSIIVSGLCVQQALQVLEDDHRGQCRFGSTGDERESQKRDVILTSFLPIQVCLTQSPIASSCPVAMPIASGVLAL